MYPSVSPSTSGYQEQHVSIASRHVYKRCFSTTDPTELQFGYHRAVRKGPFIYVSGTTAEKPPTEAHEDIPANGIIPRGSGFIVATKETERTPVGSGFVVRPARKAAVKTEKEKGKGSYVPADDNADSYDDFEEPFTSGNFVEEAASQTSIAAAAVMNKNSVTAPADLPPPYEHSGAGHNGFEERSSRQNYTNGRTTSHRIEYPDTAKAQAHVAMTRSIHAVQALGGRLEDVVRVKLYLTHHTDIDDVAEAFRHCFSVDAVARGKLKDGDGRVKRGTAGIRVGEVACAASLIVVGEGGLGNTDARVMVEVEAVAGV